MFTFSDVVWNAGSSCLLFPVSSSAVRSAQWFACARALHGSGLLFDLDSPWFVSWCDLILMYVIWLIWVMCDFGFHVLVVGVFVSFSTICLVSCFSVLLFSVCPVALWCVLSM